MFAFVVVVEDREIAVVASIIELGILIGFKHDHISFEAQFVKIAHYWSLFS